MPRRKELSIRVIAKIKDPAEKARLMKDWGRDRVENYFMNPKYSIYKRFKFMNADIMRPFISAELKKQLTEELKAQMEYDYLKFKMEHFHEALEKFKEKFEKNQDFAIKEILSSGSKKGSKEVMDSGADFESMVSRRNSNKP